MVPVTARERKNIWRGFLFVFLFLTGVYILFKSPLFEVKKIEVQGNNQLAKNEIIKASGLYKGVNIFKISVKEARANLSAIPVLKEVIIRRDLPSTISIVVKERQAFALLPVENGFVEIDEQGVFIRKSNKIREGLPVLTGMQFAAATPGEKIAGQELDKVLKAVGELPPSLVVRLSEIHFSDGALVLYTAGGVQCRLGSLRGTAEKGKILLQVLDELKGKNKVIEYVDLSFVGSPVVKYK